MRRKIFLFSLIGLFLLFTYYAYAFLDFKTSDRKSTRYFSKRGMEVKIHYKSFEGRTIRFLEVEGKDLSTLVIFVHGTPGSSDNFFEYMADSLLLQGARMVSIDRLGYGGSDYGHAHNSIEEQARQVHFVAGLFKHDRLVLVGHSFGGPIIIRCAMDYPEEVSAVLMLAPAIDPENEKYFFIGNLGKWKTTRWLLPGALKVSGDEKYSHEEELRKMSDGWPFIRCRVVHMHGNKDTMVPFENYRFTEKMGNPALLKMITLEGANHFIPWNRFEEIRDELVLLVAGY